MAWFKPKPPVDTDEFEWLMACFAWLHRTLGQQDQADGYVPVLARPDTPDIAGAEGATALFGAIKALAGLQEWDCELRQGDPVPELTASNSLIAEQYERRALGTFSIEAAAPVPRYGQFGEPIVDAASPANAVGRPVIHYDPALLRQPDALAATFAHELAHLVGHRLGDPPGGDALHEHATDCTAVYLGFGIFLANSARHFAQFQDGAVQGWSSQTSGYLSERALVTVLAMHVRLFGFPAQQASEPLKSYLRADFSKALKYLDWRFPDFPAALGQVDLAEWA